MDDWTDLRHFIAVAETGSTLAAGRKLRVSQTTTARRIAALEASLGLRLFDRRQAGYLLTADGIALLAEAQAVEAAADAFAASAAARVRAAAGTIRLTCSEIFAVTLLPRMLRDFHQAHPDLRIELDTSDAVRDLDAGAADIAVRVAINPSGAGLVGRRVADDDWTVYCSRAYAEERGVPRTVSGLSRHPLIGGGEPGVWVHYRAWMVAAGVEHAVVMHHSTSLGLLAAVRSGLGLAALPCFIADQEPDLIQCLPTPKAERGWWLLTHERLRHEPRVRAALDFLHARLAPLAKSHTGHPVSPPT